MLEDKLVRIDITSTATWPLWFVAKHLKGNPSQKQGLWFSLPVLGCITLPLPPLQANVVSQNNWLIFSFALLVSLEATHALFSILSLAHLAENPMIEKKLTKVELQLFLSSRIQATPLCCWSEPWLVLRGGNALVFLQWLGYCGIVSLDLKSPHGFLPSTSFADEGYCLRGHKALAAASLLPVRVADCAAC